LGLTHHGRGVVAKGDVMSTTVDTETEIRSFRIEIPEEQIDDLRRRIASTRRPTEELVPDRSQGVQLATPPEVSVPVGFTTFPGEIFQAPRSWVEQSYPNLIHFNEADKGGHFAAWEEPELFAGEMRAAFSSLR